MHFPAKRHNWEALIPKQQLWESSGEIKGLLRLLAAISVNCFSLPTKQGPLEKENNASLNRNKYLSPTPHSKIRLLTDRCWNWTFSSSTNCFLEMFLCRSAIWCDYSLRCFLYHRETVTQTFRPQRGQSALYGAIDTILKPITQNAIGFKIQKEQLKIFPSKKVYWFELFLMINFFSCRFVAIFSWDKKKMKQKR